jgi:hypothetical protein
MFHTAEVARDGEEIGLDGSVPESTGQLPGAEKCLGCDILGERRIAGKKERESIDVARVGVVEIMKLRRRRVHNYTMREMHAGYIVAAVFICGSAWGDSKNQEFSDFTTPLPLPPGQTLVIGIVGGWERWDDPARIVRRIAIAVDRKQLPGVYVETVENHRPELAQELVRRALDRNGDGKIDPGEARTARIVLFGQSLGGREVVRLCRTLAEWGVEVRLALLIDAFGKEDYALPPNVAEAVNLYQPEWPIRGSRTIRAEDATKTRILGNFRYDSAQDRPLSDEYDVEPYLRRSFMGGHLKMEYDPAVWARAEELILDALRAR